MGYSNSRETYLATNTATAVNETLPAVYEPHRRTSVIRLDVEKSTSSQFVIRDSITGLPIERIFRTENPNHKQESLINLAMLHDLNSRQVGDVAVWLSPPRLEIDLPLGKILVATKYEHLDQQQIVEYDVTGEHFSMNEFVNFKILLRDHFRNGYFIISQDQDPWSLLRLVIPMDQAWDQMQNGEAEKLFKELVDQMRPLVRKKRGDELMVAVYSQTGADIRLACPVIETSFVKREISSKGNFVEHCGKCGIDIHKIIDSGYVCSGCGGTYEGC